MCRAADEGVFHKDRKGFYRGAFERFRESADDAQIPRGSKDAFAESNSGETDFSARLIKFVIYCAG